ncbi:rCG34590 [Rattus norvegicus]|uniref:RCG34590 n=1 Tax=Rattus norvegicus TaxID=10116 RepID=A6HDE9_RAT|nr:rCG34590 [Rattus norvegicus]
MPPRRSIVEVKVLDVQKRRVPNKHYTKPGSEARSLLGLETWWWHFLWHLNDMGLRPDPQC